ncbi:MAG: helix-turn-helix domain-containing protein, partial [Terrimicrobiaceae bacterium]|nr:helix-turn-helix domain-containing protein [Terrimicrobiaceae bacterium]
PRGAREPWVFSWINLYGELAMRAAGLLRAAHGPVLPMAEGGAAADLFFDLLERASKPREPFEHAADCFSFLCAWMREIEGPAAGAQNLAARAASALAARHREAINVKSLAAELGVSREHLTRVFVREHGCGPAEYLRIVRARAARRLLALGGLSRRETALRCGFPSARAMRLSLGERGGGALGEEPVHKAPRPRAPGQAPP